MDTYKERLASWEAELRKTYTQAERDEMAKNGQALPDGSYPIKTVADVSNAIATVGLGNTPSATIRQHIIKRAKALGCSDKIPDSWNADGSKQQNDTEPDTEARAQCATCDGAGTIMDGHRVCPDCDGSGEAPGSDSSGETEEDSAKRNPALVKRHKDRHRAVPLLPEVRLFRGQEGLEIREADREGNLVTIRGAVVVYNQPYVVRDMFGEFEERMHPGVARDVMGDDTRYLYNHTGMVLARTASKTLALEDTPTALWTNATVDIRNTHANDLVIAVQRGDVSQMSVGFVCGLDEWNEAMDQRDVYRFSAMPDTSAVSFPAAPMTTLEIAQRMALEMPIESRARFRKLAVDERAGKTLSQANANKITAAHAALASVLSAAGLGVDEPDVPDEGDGSSSGASGSEAEPSTAADGSTSLVDPGESIDVRNDPTPEDYSVAQGLTNVKVALAHVKATQLTDPDNGTDPDDKAVMSAIVAAEAAVDKAIVAQSKDGRPDPDGSKSKSSRALWLRAEARKRRVLP